MASTIASTNLKIISEFDDAGIKLAMQNVDASKRMLAGMSVFGATKDASMGDVMAERNRARQEEDEAYQKRARTEQTLSQARILSTTTEARALAQKFEKQEYNERTLAAIEKTRHEQAMAFIFQEGQATEGKTGFGNRGSTTADNNRNNAGFQGAMAIQQAGFMVQDFQSQLLNAKTTAEGFGRGMMAISNNIQMLGMAWGPTGLAISSIAGAAAGIIVPAVARWLDDTKALEEKNKAIESSYSRISTLVKGMQQGNLFAAGGSGEAEKAKTAIDGLTDKMTSIAQTSNAIRVKIAAAQAEGGRDVEIDAWRKHQTELNAEYDKAEMERAGIQEVWNSVRLRDSLKKIEEEKAAKKAADIEEQDNEKTMDDLKRQQADELRAEDEKIRRQFDVRQSGLRNRIEDLRDMPGGLNPNGPSSASIAGSSAAASAINRALSGSRSEENDRKQLIKIAEEELKVLNRLEQKMNFRRAGLVV